MLYPYNIPLSRLPVSSNQILSPLLKLSCNAQPILNRVHRAR